MCIGGFPIKSPIKRIMSVNEVLTPNNLRPTIISLCDQILLDLTPGESAHLNKVNIKSRKLQQIITVLRHAIDGVSNREIVSIDFIKGWLAKTNEELNNLTPKHKFLNQLKFKLSSKKSGTDMQIQSIDSLINDIKHEVKNLIVYTNQPLVGGVNTETKDDRIYLSIENVTKHKK